MELFTELIYYYYPVIYDAAFMNSLKVELAKRPMANVGEVGRRPGGGGGGGASQ